MNSYCVYKHTTPSGKVYIGITCQTVQKRWKNGKGYELCTAFDRAIQKYGWKNIQHEVLYTGMTEQEACEKEVELIKLYRSHDPAYGYNLTFGGEHYEPTEEWRARVSESQKKRFRERPEDRAKISLRQIGRKASEETKSRMSTSRKRYLDEHPEMRSVCGNSFRGKKRSEENVRKLKEANKRPVRCDSNGKIYESVDAAAADIGVCRSSVSNVLTGRSKTAGGLQFSYV